MTKEEALKTRCSCGRQPVGGWWWDKWSGSRPTLHRITMHKFLRGVPLSEHHTLDACYRPHRIRPATSEGSEGK
jgi:hypothetical protein